jgi:hypothetical protein
MNPEKKQWIAPQATEIEVNGGFVTNAIETSLGTLS